MPRNKKITKEIIYKTANQIVEKNSVEKLTAQNLATKLGVKAPSLYGHIKSLTELKKEISRQANHKIGLAITSNIKQKTGDDAIRALALAYREFALKHRGLYQLSVDFPMKNSKAWVDSYIRLRDLFASVLRDNYTLTEREVRTLARTLRSLLHGYISLEHSGGWSDIIEIKKSFQTSIDHFILSVNGIASSNKFKKSKRTSTNS